MKKTIYFLLGVLISMMLCVPSYGADQCGSVTQSPSVASGTWFTGTPSGTPKYYVTGTFQTFASCDNYLASGVLQIITPPNVVTGDYYKIGSSGELLTYDHCYSNIYNLRSYTIDSTAVYTGECVVESCSDGILNQDETTIDCGGVCGSCEPVHCSSGVQDGDESGIDCGGSCDQGECTEYCPVDWTNLYGTCYSPEVNMINGNCPEGTTGENLTDGTCIKSQPVTYANDSYVDPNANDSLDWVFNDQNSPWVSNVTESTVDNGDGTSTTTTTTTTTINNYDGTTSTNTSTTNTVVNNTTGAVQSSSTTGTETTSTPSNIQGKEGQYDGTLTEGVDYPSESLFSDMLDGFNFGGSGTPLGDTSMQIVDPVCSITMGDYEISFCGEPYTGWFATFSTLLLAFAYLGAIYIVFRR